MGHGTSTRPLLDPEPLSEGPESGIGKMTDLERYDYSLPGERIAARPMRPRDAARLLVLRRNGEEILHREVRDLPELLLPGDRIVINETKVIPARVRARVARSNREIEILLVRESSPGRWTALVRPMRALRPDDRIVFENEETIAIYEGRDGEAARLSFNGDVASLIRARGHVPLPSYVGREDSVEDREDYQTIFARIPGAIAAPTAGLHFTPDLLARIASRGIGISRIVLHVGPGTFRPLRVPNLQDHKVDPEYYSVSPGAAREIVETKAKGGRIVAVGTTTVRAVETWAREAGIDSEVGGIEGWTDLTIVPPWRPLVVDCLMTNFHLPRSSLLVLVSAFAGRERIMGAYAMAIREGYRFYSYGDAMLIL